jgi:uncharacterized membrane protein (DUF373 family)
LELTPLKIAPTILITVVDCGLDRTRKTVFVNSFINTVELAPKKGLLWRIQMELHDKIYKKVIYNVTVVVLYILLLLIIVGVFDIFQTMWAVLMKTSNINDVVYNVLTIFVLIDLFKTFSDYRVQERIRITYVTDATILILMREITVMVYSHDFEIYVLLAFAALLLVLCIMRFISMNYHPTDNSVSLIKKKDTEDE